MRSLILSATSGSWLLFVARKVDPTFQRFREKVFERDQHTCQYCGFQAHQYQEVINIDGNYKNNKLSNMLTACCFCTQCLFLEAVGKNDYGGGSLIYLPDLGQADLNGLCHVLFCAIANATSYRTDAQNVYRNLKLRSQQVEEHVGEGMSNPARLGQMLIDANIDDRQQLADKILSKVRLLPSRSKFSEQIEVWAQAALNEMAEQKG